MIKATQVVYYDGRMFKPNENLPCYDTKMVQAWLKSGVAKDTEVGQAKPVPTISKVEAKEEEPIEEKQKEEKPKKVEVKTRSKKNE